MGLWIVLGNCLGKGPGQGLEKCQRKDLGNCLGKGLGRYYARSYGKGQWYVEGNKRRTDVLRANATIKRNTANGIL